MTFTKEQIHDAIINRHKEVFGYIGKDDEGEEVHRDGYFIAGFVKDALDNFEQRSEPVSLKRIVSVLPDDKETEEWFNINIDGDSASSAIYKFRLWLKEREKAH